MLGDPFCVRNGIGEMSEDVLVADDGGLENVIVYVGSGHPDLSYPVPADPVVLDQARCRYTPHVLTLMVGQDLRVLNSDDTFHNVRAEAGGATFFNFAQPVMGAEDIETFAEPGIPIRIGCSVHGWMRSWAGVFDHPFHTVSDASGDFVLNLPPGSYEIVAWHERYGEMRSRVELAEGDRARLNFAFSAGGA